MPAIYHEGSWLGNATDPEVLVKDTVGWTGKNLLKLDSSYTDVGISMNIQSNGVTVLNGTSTGVGSIKFSDRSNSSKAVRLQEQTQYIFSVGDELNGVTGVNLNIGYSDTNGQLVIIGNSEEGATSYQFTLPASAVDRPLNVGITVKRAGVVFNNITLYPMLRKADITDPTYEPYHESVEEEIEQIYAGNGVLGAKNLLPYTRDSSTYTQSGVTYTRNADGSITANGTATANSFLPIAERLKYPINNLKKGVEYILSGDYGLGSGNGYVYVNFYNGSTRLGGVSTAGTGSVKFVIPESINGTVVDGIDFGIGVLDGKTVNNFTFYPMIRLASDPDDTYQPYAMTNRELTDSKADKTDVDSNIDELKSYFGILTTPVPSYVANTLPVLKRNITSAFYNGSLRGEIAAGNFKNVRPGDYIIGQATGSTYYVAMCDYRLGKGDKTNNANYPAYGTHHLGLMLFKPVGTTALWRGYGHSSRSWRVSATDLGRCPWNAALDADPANTEAVGADNTNITRTYGSANVSGYMGSFIRERIDAILLPQCFQADFGSANVLKYREINGNAVVTDKPSGGQGNWNGCTSGWGWYDRYIDLPSEVELYGSRIFGSGMDAGCQCEQLPLFRNAAIHDFYPRIDIWTKAVASSSRACIRAGGGDYANTDTASNAPWACPLACVK